MTTLVLFLAATLVVTEKWSQSVNFHVPAPPPPPRSSSSLVVHFGQHRRREDEGRPGRQTVADGRTDVERASERASGRAGEETRRSAGRSDGGRKLWGCERWRRSGSNSRRRPRPSSSPPAASDSGPVTKPRGGAAAAAATSPRFWVRGGAGVGQDREPA